MQATDPAINRPKVVRVVTASYVVPWHLANTLRRISVDFDVYVVGKGVAVYRDAYPDVNWIDVNIERRIAPLADLIALARLCWIFSAIKPDIVHSIMPKAGLLAALAGFLCRVPVRVHTFTGQVWANRQGLSRKLFYLIDKAINSLNTVCLTDSPSQSDFLLTNGLSASGRRLPFLSKGSLCGVDTVRFRVENQARVRIRMESGIPEQAYVFLFLGRLSRDKGVLDLAAAFAKLPCSQCDLLFVGPDEEGMVEQLRVITAACCERVHFVGYASNPEDYMASADMFCLPSYREGFGTVVIEAAAACIPSIGTRIAGVVDAIDEGKTGVLYPAGDVDALRDLMRDCVDHPGKYHLFGMNARQRVLESFGADVLYGALRQFYTDMIDRSRASGPKTKKVDL